MKRAFQVGFLLVVFCSCKMNGQMPLEGNIDSMPRILIYGLQNLVRRNAEDLLAPKYGFVFYPVAGCL